MDRLRPLLPADAALVFTWRNRAEIRRAMFDPEPLDWVRHVAWIERTCAADDRRYFLLERAGTALGLVGFQDISERHGTARWGFYVGAAEAPRGTGTVLCTLGLERFFTELGLRRVQGEALADNPASLRLHRRLGFVHEGCLHGAILRAHEPVDVHLFGLWRELWKGRWPR